MQKRKSKIIGIKFFHSSIQTRILVILAFNSTGVIISCNKPVNGWLRKISVYVIMEVVEIKKNNQFRYIETSSNASNLLQWKDNILRGDILFLDVDFNFSLLFGNGYVNLHLQIL